MPLRTQLLLPVCVAGSNRDVRRASDNLRNFASLPLYSKTLSGTSFLDNCAVAASRSRIQHKKSVPRSLVGACAVLVTCHPPTLAEGEKKQEELITPLVNQKRKRSLSLLFLQGL